MQFHEYWVAGIARIRKNTDLSYALLNRIRRWYPQTKRNDS